MSFVVHRVAKSAARYTDAGGREKCGYCRFFVAPRACGKVIGPVSPRGWCKYFSRQAAQQYRGAGITGGGGPPGATLSLDFMSSGNMPAGVTFTRASTATYTDASGLIQAAAVNQPRWDYAGGSLRGLLIEEARTNLAFPSVNWLAGSVPSGSVDGITQNAGPGLSGVNNAMALIPGAFSGVHQFFTTFGGAPGTPYVYSFYAKPAGMNFVYMELANTGFTGTGQVAIFNLGNGAIDSQSGGANAMIQPTGNGWYRLSVTATSSAGAGTYVSNIRPGATNTIGGSVSTGNNVDGIWVWGQQVEAGTFVSSLIPTTSGTAARAMDSCVIPPANTGFFVPPGGTWFAEFVNFTANMTGKNMRIIGQTAAGSTTPLWEDATTKLIQYDGGFLATANTIVANAITKGVSGWSVGSSKTCLNGGPVAALALATGYAALATNGITLFGATPAAAATEAMSGYLRRVQYWPRLLSDTEMQQVTT